MKSKASVNKQELLKYVNDKDNRVALAKDVNGVSVSVIYQPFQLFVLQEIEGETNVDDSSTLRKLEDKYKNQYYFKLKFSKNGKKAIRQVGDFNKYSNLVQTLSFRMGNYVNLTTSQKDTLDLRDYIFDQTYGMSDGNSVLLSFDKTKINDGKNFDINVNELGFGTGSLKFSFRKEDIEKVPKLDYFTTAKQIH